MENKQCLGCGELQSIYNFTNCENKELCSDCDLEEREQAYERFLDSYYGDSQPVTLKEKQKKSLQE